MSGTRSLFVPGQAAVDTDIQTLATQAANAGDEVQAALAAPGGFYVLDQAVSVDRVIFPLAEEGGTATGYFDQLLVVPSTSLTGAVDIRPAVYNCSTVLVPPAGSATYTTPQMIANQYNKLTSALISSNSSGNSRIDLIYATIARAVATTGSRKYKSPSDGSVSTQTVNLTDAVTVTITVLPGTPAASPSAPSLPGDNYGSAWTFALAWVTVPNGFASGSAITASNITQTWIRGGIHQEHMRPIMGNADVNVMPNQIGPKLTAFCPVKYTAVNQVATLLGSNQYDMRRRMIRIECSRAGDNTEAGQNPSTITVGGSKGGAQINTGWVFTGTNGAAGTPCATATLTACGSGATDVTVKFYADSSTGALCAKFITNGPFNAGGDYFVFVVDFFGSMRTS